MNKIYLPNKYEFMPDKRKYLLRVGLKDKIANINEKLKSTINKIYKIGLEISEPKIFWNEYITNQVKNIIPKEFINSSKIIFWASTLGSNIDSKIEEFLNSNQTLEATLLDAWGSESIEALNDSFNMLLKKNTINLSKRFSPGYKDLDIKVNFEILKILNVKEIVSNPSTGILSPRKSTVCIVSVLHN